VERRSEAARAGQSLAGPLWPVQSQAVAHSRILRWHGVRHRMHPGADQGWKSPAVARTRNSAQPSGRLSRRLYERVLSTFSPFGQRLFGMNLLPHRE
jgi:hypothetical protein